MASRYADLSRDQLITLLLQRDAPVATHVINPLTGRKVKIRGPTYNRLVKNGTITPIPQTAIPPPPDFQDVPPKPQHPTASLIRDAQKKGVKLRPHHPTASLVRQAYKKDIQLRPVASVSLMETALKSFTKSYKVKITNRNSLFSQLNNTVSVVHGTLVEELLSMIGIKLVISVKIEFEKEDGDDTTYKSAYFNSKAVSIINVDEIAEIINLQNAHLLEKVDRWIGEGSGWSISKVEGHWLNINIYIPLTGSSYIQLPEQLRNSKKGIINIQNKHDHECFRWCHLAHKYPAPHHAERTSHYQPHINSLNYENIVFPVEIKSIGRIEQQNNICINVFGYEKGQPYPIYISKERFDENMDLLLITDGENKHYCLIKDFNRFMFCKSKHSNKKHFCRYCLQCFSTQEVLTNHRPVCLEINGKQAVKMPDEDKANVRFGNYQKQLPAPFVIYADFESITEPLPGHVNTYQKSYTHAYQKHTACSYGYKVICCYDETYSKPVQIFRGENAGYKFLEAMKQEVDYCTKTMKKYFNKDMVLTSEDRMNFREATTCHICSEKLGDANDKQLKPVRDHCHITGKYRGAAHNICNISFRLTDKIPVIFHNLRGYDSHILVQQMGQFVKQPENYETVWKKEGSEWASKQQEMSLNVIPNNMEKYMAMMMGAKLVFIDSFQFMNQSLDRLAGNLKELPILQKECPEHWELLSTKGVYPYDYMNSWSKFEETGLPSKEEFYSILNDEDISNEDYSHAQKVWQQFNIQDMGEYHDLYLKTDVLLLADVFESFRKTCSQYYKLDPAHYFTSPGLAWDAALKMTGITLDLITDVDMYQFIEKGMRGGVSYIANRYSKANNKYLSDYDSSQPSKYLMYLDANNLYGWAMSQCLPTGGFKWVQDEVDLAEYKDNSETGLILEVDLEYPQELHDLHNDYPLAPEQIEVQESQLSEYSKKLKEKFKIKVGGIHKLVPTLATKKKYVLHYRNLQLYLSLGLKLTKVYRVLEFDQSPWLKQYIDFNTKKRKEAKNEFEKDFFKLMNNSVFGKTMENIRKRVDVRLVANPQKLAKLVSKPTFVSSKIINEDMVVVHKIKECITLNKPAYVGMSILDLSKTLMYDFHYNYIKRKYGHRAVLCFTDTDSLTYEIQTEDVYKDLWKDKDLFDNSGYLPSSPFYDSANKKVIGKMKDEAGGVPITEFVGLRSKMYSYTKEDGKGGKTAKGVKKCVIKKNITHENYKETLFQQQQLHHKMKTIRSAKHRLYSYEINKTSLSCFDDKRYISDDGVHTLAYGHIKL